MHQREKIKIMKHIQRLIIAAILVSLIAILSHADGIHHRGIRLDPSTGITGKLDLPGPDYDIKAEYGYQAGSNLFHSFQQFNIHSDESATFTGPGSVQNIISRVTGGDSSWIDGRLISEIPGANLYLLNPAGVMFGPNASLSLGGSFHVSTADYLRMEDNKLFYSEPLENDLLSAAPPVAFGFTGDNPADISFKDSFIEVSEGETLSVTGGHIQIHNSTLFARGGVINLTGTASEGEIKLDSGLKPDRCTKLGTITISRDSAFKQYNESTYYGDITVSGMEKGHDTGKVFIRGERFELRGGFVDANTRGDSDGNGIDIRVTEDIVLENGALESGALSSGNAGNIDIKAKQVCVEQGGYITTTSLETGNSGDIMISAESVGISGNNGRNNSGILAQAYGKGNGGKINLSALEIVADKGGMISAGTVSDGMAGQINLDTGMLTVSNGAGISCNTRGNGDGGLISISADESVNISGQDYFGGVYANTYGKGRGGIITLSSSEISIDKGGNIQADSEGDGKAGEISLDMDTLTLSSGAQISGNSGGTGRGGIISITAEESVKISGGNEYVQSGIFIDNYARGYGGNITVSSPKTELSEGGIIASRSTGTGNSGQIRINADTLTLTNGGQIRTEIVNGSGTGGNIWINAGKSVNISGKGIFTSGIYATSGFGSSTGGDIFVFSPDMKLDNDGEIRVETSGTGSAGMIKLDVNTLSFDRGASVSSRTYGNGFGGEINIFATDSVNISGKGQQSSGLYSVTGPDGKQGGRIILSTADLVLDKEAKIQSDTVGDGKAGQIRLNANALFLNNGAQVSSWSLGSGNGGDIELHSARLNMKKNASITAKSAGSGEGGRIILSNLQTISMNDSSIITTNLQGDGGDMVINTGTGLHLSNSRIAAYAQNGSGSNITINPGSVIMNNSKIIANAHNAGSGNLFVISNQFVRSSDSIVYASSKIGINGLVEIESPDKHITGGLAPMPFYYLEPEKQIVSYLASYLKMTGSDSFSFSNFPPLNPTADNTLGDF